MKEKYIFAGLVALALLVGLECYRQAQGKPPALPWLPIWPTTDKAAPGRSNPPANRAAVSMN